MEGIGGGRIQGILIPPILSPFSLLINNTLKANIYSCHAVVFFFTTTNSFEKISNCTEKFTRDTQLKNS